MLTSGTRYGKCTIELVKAKACTDFICEMGIQRKPTCLSTHRNRKANLVIPLIDW